MVVLLMALAIVAVLVFALKSYELENATLRRRVKQLEADMSLLEHERDGLYRTVEVLQTGAVQAAIARGWQDREDRPIGELIPLRPLTRAPEGEPS